MANQETGQAFSRYVDRGVEKPAPTPAELTLDELLVHAGSEAGARSELIRRAVWPAAAFVLPLLAIILSRAHNHWRYRSALGATVAAFVVCLVFWNRAG
jgi:lipopolysaccharide export LptBFGC system permease protein LptF